MFNRNGALASNSRTKTASNGKSKESNPGAKAGLTAGAVSIPYIQPWYTREDIPDEIEVLDNQIDLGQLTSAIDQFNASITRDLDHKPIGEIESVTEFIKMMPAATDNIMHFGFSYGMSSLATKAVDQYTDSYDPKKVALGGMAVVPLYFAAKEGFYEGGQGFQLDMESADVRGDLISDTAGALYNTFRYHQKKAAEDDRTTERSTIDNAAHKTGRKIGELEHGIKKFLNREQIESDLKNYLEPNQEEFNSRTAEKEFIHEDEQSEMNKILNHLDSYQQLYRDREDNNEYNLSEMHAESVLLSLNVSDFEKNFKKSIGQNFQALGKMLQNNSEDKIDLASERLKVKRNNAEEVYNAYSSLRKQSRFVNRMVQKVDDIQVYSENMRDDPGIDYIDEKIGSLKKSIDDGLNSFQTNYGLDSLKQIENAKVVNHV